MSPEEFSTELASAINAFVDWLVINYADFFETISNSLLFVLVKLERGLRFLPWYLVAIGIAAIGFHATRRPWLSMALFAALALIWSFNLWDMAMQTLAIMLVATAISVLIGVPTGVLLSRSDRLRTTVLPILDAMQTMPSFVYLIPALMLFGLGKVPAIIATVIYAVPPLIRLTDLGIRLVDREVMEAARAFGASRRQQLFGVQLPLALPNIMAGINQTTMMALAMVVIASMIGARGLGEQVLLGLQRLDVGKATLAGLAIVALAIVLDRITQAYGKKAEAHRGGDAV